MTELRKDTVYDWLRYHGQYNPEDLAAVDLATDRRLTYRQMDDRVTRLATGLRGRHGVGRGDRVALLARNSTDHFELMFACWKLGAIFLPLNWRLAPPELAELLGHSAPKLVLCDAEFLPLLPAGCVCAVRRPGLADCEYEELIATHGPDTRMPDLDLDAVHTLLYTSGTTGRPKGVIYNFRMTMNIVTASALHAELTRHSRTLTYLPLFHAAGLNAGAMPGFHWGATVFVMRRWDAAEALHYLTDPALGITHSFGVPTHYIAMSELADFGAARFPTLRNLGIGSAPVSPAPHGAA